MKSSRQDLASFPGPTQQVTKSWVGPWNEARQDLASFPGPTQQVTKSWVGPWNKARQDYSSYLAYTEVDVPWLNFRKESSVDAANVNVVYQLKGVSAVSRHVLYPI